LRSHQCFFSAAYGEEEQAILKQHGVLTAFLDPAPYIKLDVSWSLVPYRLYHLNTAASVPDMVKQIFDGRFPNVIRHFHRFIRAVAEYHAFISKEAASEGGNRGSSTSSNHTSEGDSNTPITSGGGDGSISESSGVGIGIGIGIDVGISGDGSSSTDDSCVDATSSSGASRATGDDEPIEEDEAESQEEQVTRRKSARIAARQQILEDEEEEEEEDQDDSEVHEDSEEIGLRLANMRLERLKEMPMEQMFTELRREWRTVRECLFPEIPFVGLGLGSSAGNEYGLMEPSTIRIIINLLKLIDKIDTSKEDAGYLFLFFNLFHMDVEVDKESKVGCDKMSDTLVCLLLPQLLDYTERVARELERSQEGREPGEARLQFDTFTWPKIHQLVGAWGTADHDNFNRYRLSYPLWRSKKISFKEEGYRLPCLMRDDDHAYPRIFVPSALAAKMPREHTAPWAFNHLWYNETARKHFSSLLSLEGALGRSTINDIIKQMRGARSLLPFSLLDDW
jgi:hypothetical protein